MIKGRTVVLRAIAKKDLARLRQWRNSPLLRQYFREYREITKEMQEAWWQKIARNDPNTVMVAIADSSSGQLIGAAGLCYINWVSRNAEISVYVGDKGVYIDNRAKEACKLLINYGFKTLGLHKIWTEVYEFDRKKYSMLTDKLGFKRDGVLRDHCFFNGKFHDSFIVSIINEG